MTSGQKTIASLIFSIIIFACFVIASFAGLFSKVETRFYEPIKISSIQKQLDTISEKSENYINSHIEKFASEYLVQSSIASYASQQANDDDVKMRTQITGNLFSTTSALDGIRLIDSNGRNVHFSTYQNDILRENASLKMYKNYSDLQSPSGKNEFSFSSISTDSNDAKTSCRITYDGSEKRILLSFPFYDSYNAYRGTIIFYLSSDDFARTLLAQNIISVNDSCTLISNSNGTIGGFVFGMPVVGRDILEKEILEHWQKNSAGPTRILAIAPDESSENKNDNHSQNTYWILISSTQAKVAKISGVYNESTFVMNKTLQTLLQVCAFVTLFLIIFMLFNIRQDD
ncbi:MAG: hypothetical protein IJR49_04365, partial [Treponema sp.]|nr:hypothetical protein [Treponema sp.]